MRRSKAPINMETAYGPVSLEKRNWICQCRHQPQGQSRRTETETHTETETYKNKKMFNWEIEVRRTKSSQCQLRVYHHVDQIDSSNIFLEFCLFPSWPVVVVILAPWPKISQWLTSLIGSPHLMKNSRLPCVNVKKSGRVIDTWLLDLLHLRRYFL